MIQWHWVSSAICLAGMFLFSITGITLNHAGAIESRPAVERLEFELPADLLAALNEAGGRETKALPAAVAARLRERLPRGVGSTAAEWSAEEVYLSMPEPGGDGWLTIDRETGGVEYERTNRGWVAYFNDLHKGRHAGTGWKWFIDVFAASTLIFCATGVYLLYFHARHRRMTWPVVALGVIIPAVIAALMSQHP